MKSNLSEHFTYRELTYSSTSNKHKIDNTPNEKQIQNLIRLCQTVLEPIRIKYGKPIIVTSGFRCDELNELVNGSKTSYHKEGLAVDIKCDDNKALFNLIKKMIQSKEISVDQLIDEKKLSWIHIGIKENQQENRNQILKL